MSDRSALQIALDHHQAIGGKRRDLAAERAGKLGVAHRHAFGLHQRIDVGQPGAEVGIFPGLDAAMRQAEAAIGLDRLGAASSDTNGSRAPGSAFSAASNMSR